MKIFNLAEFLNNLRGKKKKLMNLQTNMIENKENLSDDEIYIKK